MAMTITVLKKNIDRRLVFGLVCFNVRHRLCLDQILNGGEYALLAAIAYNRGGNAGVQFDFRRHMAGIIYNRNTHLSCRHCWRIGSIACVGVSQTDQTQEELVVFHYYPAEDGFISLPGREISDD